tara:strand:- start:2685 stop:3647 length:963 start_codon:yes stop_codon:yes gene_type:complete
MTLQLMKAGVSPQDALERFGLDWETGMRPLYRRTGCPEEGGPDVRYEPTTVHETFNGSTGDTLGTVSDKYCPIQNRQIADLLEHVSPGARNVVGGGTYRGGKRAWFQLDLGTFDVAGVDPMRKYAIVSTDHDGTGGLTIAGSTIRLTCFNQYRAATRDSYRVSIRHTSEVLDIDHLGKRVAAGLERVRQWASNIQTMVEGLASRPIGGDWAERFFRSAYLACCNSATRALILDPQEETRDHSERAIGRMASAVATMANNLHDRDSGALHPSIEGTRWHAFNAATEWVDHSGRYGAESVHLGNAADHKVRMMELAVSTSTL